MPEPRMYASLWNEERSPSPSNDPSWSCTFGWSNCYACMPDPWLFRLVPKSQRPPAAASQERTRHRSCSAYDVCFCSIARMTQDERDSLAVGAISHWSCFGGSFDRLDRSVKRIDDSMDALEDLVDRFDAVATIAARAFLQFDSARITSTLTELLRAGQTDSSVAANELMAYEYPRFLRYLMNQLTVTETTIVLHGSHVRECAHALANDAKRWNDERPEFHRCSQTPFSLWSGPRSFSKALIWP